MEYISIFDEKRIRIIQILYLRKEDFCGIDLAKELGISKNLLSYHLKILERSGLIESERCGRKKKYKIVKEHEKKVKKILEILELK